MAKVYSPEGQRLHVFLQYAIRDGFSHPWICFQVEQLAECRGSSPQTVEILSITGFKFSYFKCFNSKNGKVFLPLNYQFTRTCVVVTYFSC